MFKSMNKRISVDLPENLYKRLKLLCVTEDLKLGDTIRSCVERFCDETEKDMEIVSKETI